MLIIYKIHIKEFIYLFLKRGREGEKGEKHQCVVASGVPPTGDLACNPGIFPRLGIKSTKPYQPEHICLDFKKKE